jgi:transcriptional regulator with XRE-family HTH domain
MSAESFASRLTAVREKAGLSQYELAKRTALTRQTVSWLETGKSVPNWPTERLLAAALGVDYAAFADPHLKPPAEKPAQPRGRPRKADADATELPPAKGRRRKGDDQYEIPGDGGVGTAVGGIGKASRCHRALRHGEGLSRLVNRSRPACDCRFGD